MPQAPTSATLLKPSKTTPQPGAHSTPVAPSATGVDDGKAPPETLVVPPPNTMTNSEYGNHKWVLDVSQQDAASDVAVATIRMRLEAVHHYLPLAARQPEEDIEHVHQLRVATRRTVAAVELYREFLPKGPRKKLCRILKQIRRAAGTARDCDVLIQRHECTSDSRRSKKVLEDFYEKRCEAQEPLRAVYRSSIKHQSLEKQSRRALRGVSRQATGKKSLRFDRWARRQLRASTCAFFGAEPSHLDDLDALHQFRLCGKDLRYAMELLAAAFPATLRTEIYPLIEQLQDRLGAINDHAVAMERFRRWCEESNAPRRRKRFQKLIKSENKLLDQALWDFARWWTPRRSKWIQRRFRELVNGKS